MRTRNSGLKTTSFDIMIPRISDEIVDCQVARWIKNEGDYVMEGEVIVELETEKTIIEIESPCEGVLSGIYVFEGEEVIDGERIGIINSVDSFVDDDDDEDDLDEELNEFKDENEEEEDEDFEDEELDELEEEEELVDEFGEDDESGFYR